jgi:Cdc6-like AAA superfamily ATPase
MGKKAERRIPFIGRTRRASKFLEFLKNKKWSGVFLVTGFRDMGKTSFVNYVLDRYRHETRNGSKKVKAIELTLTQITRRKSIFCG